MLSATERLHTINPDDSWKWNQIESRIRDTMSMFNFREIRLSIFQNLELLKKGVEGMSDLDRYKLHNKIVQLSKPYQHLCLRPEGTISVLNSSLSDKAAQETQKIYYLGPMFTVSEDAEVNEFTQLGVEIMGSRSLISDNEAIRLGIRLLQNLGFNNPMVEISSYGCNNCRSDFHTMRAKFIKSHKDKLCPSCSRKLAADPTYTPDCQEPGCGELIKQIPDLGDHLCEDCEAQFLNLKKLLLNLATNYKVNHHLRRNYSYYRRTVFNFVVDTAEGPVIAGGGGRYDELANQLLPNPLPSVGFELNLDRIFQQMDRKRLFAYPDDPFRIYLCQQSEGMETIMMQINQDLHNQNFSTVLSLHCHDFQAECENAMRDKCHVMIILSSEELREGRVILRNFMKEHQELVKLSDIVPHLTIIKKSTT